MKKLITLLFSVLFVFHESDAQIGIEAQIGGANFFGITVNARYSIPLNNSDEHRISPAFGIGVLAPWWDEPTTIINGGLTYNFKNWGIGAEVSGFTQNPFVISDRPRDFIDFIVYPNLNYTIRIHTKFYLRISGGAYFAYSRSTDPILLENKFRFESDVIPGAGVGVGYLIK